jgi:hypothetical protein
MKAGVDPALTSDVLVAKSRGEQARLGCSVRVPWFRICDAGPGLED